MEVTAQRVWATLQRPTEVALSPLTLCTLLQPLYLSAPLGRDVEGTKGKSMGAPLVRGPTTVIKRYRRQSHTNSGSVKALRALH